MKTKAANTSVMTYYGLVLPVLKQPQQMAILKAFAKCRGKAIDRDIVRLTGLERSSVCGRINELVDAGKLVKYDHIKSPATGRLVQRYALPEVAKKARAA